MKLVEMLLNKNLIWIWMTTATMRRRMRILFLRRMAKKVTSIALVVARTKSLVVADDSPEASASSDSDSDSQTVPQAQDPSGLHGNEQL